MSLQVSGTARAIADRLRSSIDDGTLPPGAALHQERLALEFGVSRSPVREALRLLEAHGMISYVPNRGAVVAGTSPSDLREMLEIRRLIEPALVEHLLATITRDDVEGLRDFHARMETERSSKGWLDLHREFHEKVFSFAGRPYTVRMLADHGLRFSEQKNADAVVRAVRRGVFADDWALLAALEERDGKAARDAALRHLDVLERAFTGEGRAG